MSQKQNRNIDYNYYLTLTEAAKVLRVTRGSVRTRIKKGQMPGRRVGHVYLIPRDFIFPEKTGESDGEQVLHQAQ